MGSVDDSLAAVPQPGRDCLHLSIFPFSPAVIDSVAARLEGLSLSKGTIRFTPDHPVPDHVLEEVVRLRRAEIQK
jgi:uncharacterized protein YdhG (YjbR/CyaY superfamily)